MTNKSDIQQVVKAAFKDAGLDPESRDARELIELAFRHEEGRIVALFDDASTVAAVGEMLGTYRYHPGHPRPHQVLMRWHHTRSFSLSHPVTPRGRGVMALKPEHPAVADIEASLLIHGISPWPGFSAAMRASDGEKPASFTHSGSILIHETTTQIAPAHQPAPLPALEGVAAQVAAMLARKHQVILYGPPGTGKTWHAEQIALEIVARQNFNCLPRQLTPSQLAQIHDPHHAGAYITTCTFHPMYSYEDFIEGYKPSAQGFVLEPGIFKRLATAAQAHPDKQFVLILDEINRGNIPRIFGELITLLETSKRGKTRILLPLSRELFSVPDNLLIIGTMNTADRSILLLDTALRRRFAFKELLPEPALLGTQLTPDIKLGTWLRALNRRIVAQLGHDGRSLQVGHAYLMWRGKPAATVQRIAEMVRDEIWPLLQEYCYGDPEKLAQILAADQGGIYSRAGAGLRAELFEAGREHELIRALSAIVTPEDQRHEPAVDDDSHEDEDEKAPQKESLREALRADESEPV